MVAVAAARAVTAMSDGGAGVEGADSRRSPSTAAAAAAAGAAKRKRPKTIMAVAKTTAGARTDDTTKAKK